MNRIIASAAALLALAGVAYAAETTGTVQAVDPATRTVTLDSGVTFTAPETVEVAQIVAGMKIKVTHDEGSTAATAIEAAM